MELPRARPPIPVLTSLRFFAALHVSFAHFVRAPPILKVDIGALPGWFIGLAGGAYWAVNSFFALSGFVLVYVYADRPSTKRAFWYSRFVRIYPLLFILSLLILAPQYFLVNVGHAGAADWETRHKGLVAVLVPLLLQSWVPTVAEAWNGVSWTLSVDVVCYALFPFVLDRMRRWSRARLLSLLVVNWSFVLGLSVLYLILRPDGLAPSEPGRHGSLPWLAAIRYHPLARVPEFLSGMALGFLFLKRRVESDLYATWWIVGGAAGIFVTAALVDQTPVPLWHSGVLPLATASLIYGLAMRPKWTGRLERKPFVALGELSYGFYLFHVMLIASTMMAFGHFARPFPGSVWVVLIVAVSLATGVAFLVHRFVADPVRRRLMSLAKRRLDG